MDNKELTRSDFELLYLALDILLMDHAFDENVEKTIEILREKLRTLQNGPS